MCGDETPADEYEQLAAIGAAGLAIGLCVEGPSEWCFVDTEDGEDGHLLARRFVQAVRSLAAFGDELGSNQP